MPSESGAAWTPPSSNNERRLSNSSDGSSGSGFSKALSSDSADFLATRPHTSTVIPGKPAANPLQFIKVGPADLGCKAREQLRKAELAKKTEPAKIEHQEDWQSNLDNWKSSRRKRVEHIIERCVEVRRMENEPNQPRSKSKTFNEMLEERAGRRRLNPLAVYADDDGHDLSDLGIGTSSTKSSLSEDCDSHSLASDGIDLDKNHSDVENCDIPNRKLGSSANEYDTCTTNTISSPEPEEYTYESAIEGYKSRIISQSNIVKTTVLDDNNTQKHTNGDLSRIRTSVSNKIEEKVTSLQQNRADDVKNNNEKKDLPKVDIHKRKEQFERENSQDSQTNKKLPEIANKKSIKERLSSLEKFNEESQNKSTPDLSKLHVEVKPLKERLSSLEKVKAASNEVEKVNRLSNGDLSTTMSLKDRLSSLKTQTSVEDKIAKTEVKEVSMSLKQRLSSLDAAKNKEICKMTIVEQINDEEYQSEPCNEVHEQNNDVLKTNLSGIENQMQSFYRSLDSLDINGESSPASFERIQSFEDLTDMQNNTDKDKDKDKDRLFAQNMVLDALELAFKELDSEDSFDEPKMDTKKAETKPSAPLYENIEIFTQNGDETFPLDLPAKVLEPPKEKPPPPPVEDSVDGDELLGNGNFKHTSSARRIKKEIRNKRTSFLGIEGQDDSYLDVDLTLAPRPDITSFLQEETKIEKLLYKKTLSHENEKLRESRDSGVDVDRGPSVEHWYKGSSPDTSNPHSRQNSEPYNNLTVTSDEDETHKKNSHQFANNLTTKLVDLHENGTESTIDSLDKKLQEQQTHENNEDWPKGFYDDSHTKEVLRFERELLQLEQEELRRQRDNLIRGQTQIQKTQDSNLANKNRHSMPNLNNEVYTVEIPVERSFDKRKPFVSEEHIEKHFGVEESRILFEDRVVRPPQPVLPPKPKSRESMEREISMRCSRVPSAGEYVNVDRTQVQLRPKPIPPPTVQPLPNGQYHPMSRHTLQALSAAPTQKMMSNAEWLQSRNRKPPNYQHWIVQEAEHRRIEEHRQKLRVQNQKRHSYHHDANAQPIAQTQIQPMMRMRPLSNSQHQLPAYVPPPAVLPPKDEKILSVSGKRKCSHCNEELGRGAAMIIESLSLCYHVWCFSCGVCGSRLGDGREGTDVRVRQGRLHCTHCYTNNDGRNYSRV